jgi:hypothetical protein
MKMLSAEELGALVPGIEKMGVDAARAAIKALAPHVVNDAMQSWNEHHGRELMKHAHKEGRARRLKKIQDGRAAARAAAIAARAQAPAKKGKG